MMTRQSRLAVALLQGTGIAEELEARVGVPVEATDEETHLEVAGRLGSAGALVVGLAAVPWPVLPDLHAQGSASLPAYTGVVSWYAMPALVSALARAAGAAARTGVHVLLTAGDPGAEAEPSDLAFLGELAATIAERVELPARSVAWRGTTRNPTAEAVLAVLADAGNPPEVVELPVAPGMGPDATLVAAAERLGITLGCADLGRGVQLDLLAAVIRTVAGHEEAFSSS